MNPNPLIDLFKHVEVPITAVIPAVAYLKDFIGPQQLEVLGDNCRGEEREYFKEMLVALHGHIERMPATYGNRDVEDPIVQLHYFLGSCDWWITEKDKGSPDDEQGIPPQSQAFGFACLGDPQNAELGYISIAELIAAGVELDLHWTPVPLSVVKGKLFS